MEWKFTFYIYICQGFYFDAAKRPALSLSTCHFGQQIEKIEKEGINK